MTTSRASSADPDALLERARERLAHSPRQARAIALRALPAAASRGDQRLTCDLHLLAGRCCWEMATHAEGIEHLEGALAAAKSLGDGSRGAEAHRLLAAMHDYVGNFDAAVGHHMKALALLETGGDARVRANLMRTIGVSLSKTGHFEDAIGWYRRSHELAMAAADTHSAVRSLVNTAIDLKNLGRPEESLEAYRQATALERAEPLRSVKLLIDGNMGNTLLALGRLAEAEACFAPTLAELRAEGKPHPLMNALVGLGRVRTAQGRLDEALALLGEGLEIARAHQFRPDQGAAHEALAGLHKARGETDLALAHFESFHRLTEELLRDESKRQLKGMELRMRIEQSEREAAMQREQRRELEEAFERLRADAESKDLRLLRLERESLQDAATGLPNARHLEEMLAAALRGAGADRSPLLMAIIRVRPQAGRLVPPGLLARLPREAAHVARAAIDPSHFMAHLANADFAILFRDRTLEDAIAACHGLCGAIEAHDWAAVDPSIAVRADAGLVPVRPGAEPRALLGEARAEADAAAAAARPSAERFAPADPAALRSSDLVRGELLRASYANLPLIFAMSLAAAAMLCLVVRDVIASRIWGPWLGAMVAASIAVLVLCRRFARLQPLGPPDRRWGRYATAACLAGGIVWGFGAMKLHVPDSIDYQILVAVTATLVGSSAAFGSAAYLPAYYAFFLPAAVPSAIVFLQKDDTTRVVAGVLMMLYLPVVTRFAISANRAFKESLRLRFQNVALVSELRDKKQAAESASVAKSRFLAAASHDLRQPMHALGLFLQSLRQGRLPERERRLVENIGASYDAMEALFDALLDVSRLDAGIVEPRVRAFAVSRLLARMRNDFGPQAAAKGLALSVRECSASVRSDPTLLEEIVGNLVSNAIRHTRQGRVVVGCRRSGGRLRIGVWDTGPGIPPGKQGDVFRDFVQLGNPERDRRQGLGLGLAIVERLARLLDHPVELRSAVGRGSMFSVSVPLADAPDAVAEPEATESLREPFTGRLVVVVDDDPAALAAMRILLGEWGCEVACAESGALILGKLATASRRPDLILCDYRLHGGESGQDVIAEIRAEFNEDIPAALITGDTGPERLQEARESGLPLLHKPLKAPRLRALMAQLLSQPA